MPAVGFVAVDCEGISKSYPLERGLPLIVRKHPAPQGQRSAEARPALNCSLGRSTVGVSACCQGGDEPIDFSKKWAAISLSSPDASAVPALITARGFCVERIIVVGQYCFRLPISVSDPRSTSIVPSSQSRNTPASHGKAASDTAISQPEMSMKSRLARNLDSLSFFCGHVNSYGLQSS